MAIVRFSGNLRAVISLPKPSKAHGSLRTVRVYRTDRAPSNPPVVVHIVAGDKTRVEAAREAIRRAVQRDEGAWYENGKNGPRVTAVPETPPVLAMESISADESDRMRPIAARCFACRNGCELISDAKERAEARESCSGCSLAGRGKWHSADGAPNHSGWALYYVQACRAIPRAWAPAFYAVLGRDTKEGAYLRGWVTRNGVRFID